MVLASEDGVCLVCFCLVHYRRIYAGHNLITAIVSAEPVQSAVLYERESPGVCFGDSVDR